MNINKRKKVYEALKRHSFEITMDLEEQIRNSKLPMIKDTLHIIHESEIHYIIKYHFKMILVAFYFEKATFFLEYQLWLYRVYFFKEVNLDFFIFLNRLFEEVCKKYILKKDCLEIESLSNELENEHENLKKEASYKRYILEDTQAEDFAKNLIIGNNHYITDFFNKKVSNINEFLEIYNTTISNAMKYVGFKWEANEISVAKEHIATNTLEEVILSIIENLKESEDKDKHIFLTAAPHEYHGLAIKIAALVYRKLGYKVTSLGTSMPTKEIKKAIMEFKPDYIIFSATLKASLIDIALIIDEIKKDKKIFPQNLVIGIAGAAFENIINPSKLFKTDFYLNKLEEI
ncbi:B12-binding domain-containing protein [Arcobacter sp. CECT 8983]|uniref:cobalamin B12-binding domain-containing protein n=1 Tax=Arcobacter sp. CECT 8983 TaxID=2044508 RepID=UPI0013E96424|nr:B12-binding domain-containing protein [Arcobacter sp. CECT 8983]